MIAATWPVSYPFELALLLGAVAVVGRHRAHLDNDLTELACENLRRWPAHALA